MLQQQDTSAALYITVFGRDDKKPPPAARGGEGTSRPDQGLLCRIVPP